MKKWLKSREAKKITMIILVLLMVLSAQIMGFFHFNQKLHSMSLEHSIKQVNELSQYIEKNLYLELERHINILYVVEAQLPKANGLFSTQILDHLGSVFDVSNFTMMGVSDMEGNGMDSSGKEYNISYDNIQDHIQNNRVYISNVLIKDNETLIFVAVPVQINNEIRGILWGKYPLSLNVKLVDDNYKYFQIIDDKGIYLLSSKNMLGLNRRPQSSNHCIWDELQAFAYADGVTVEQIYDSVQRKENGNFYFEQDGRGQYVSYRPLEINNWYLFSVQVDEGLNEYVGRMREISIHFFTIITISLLLLFGVIYNLIYTMYQRMARQNREMKTINVMFRSTLQQTRNIPFTINHKSKQVLFYGYPTKDQLLVCSFEEMIPENILKKGLIEPSNLGAYRRLYHSLFFEKRRCEPVILCIILNNHREWRRVSILSDEDNGSDEIVGVLEDYGEQRQKDLQIKNHLDDINKIEKKSKMDFLTQVYNRQAFLEITQEALEECYHNRKTAALLIVDLDHFKEVNDCMGHGMGDIVLQKTAETLRIVFRKDSIIGRLGGDEFMIFSQNITSIAALEEALKKLNHLVRKTYSKNGKSVKISASIGVALTGAKSSTFASLYEKADQALYDVKESGRNGFRIYGKRK